MNKNKDTTPHFSDQVYRLDNWESEHRKQQAEKMIWVGREKKRALCPCCPPFSDLNVSLLHKESMEGGENAAYIQQRGHLLCLPRQGVDNGHHVVEDLVLAGREVQHAAEERRTSNGLAQQLGQSAFLGHFHIHSSKQLLCELHL